MMNKIEVATSSPTSSDWDAYWSVGRKSQVVYAWLADLYRKLIIRNSLRRTFVRNVPPGARCLHAGSGSGDVDLNLSPTWDILGLDFSAEAVRIYARNHQDACLVLQADNFYLPFPSEQFDCVFNLGVMEHFSHDDVKRMLTEFKRVLLPGGRLILFWPPRYGMSVFVLRIFHKIAKLIKDDFTPLHPTEISLITSRKSVTELLKNSGFVDISFRFEARDLFTHEIVTATAR